MKPTGTLHVYAGIPVRLIDIHEPHLLKIPNEPWAVGSRNHLSHGRQRRTGDPHARKVATQRGEPPRTPHPSSSPWSRSEQRSSLPSAARLGASAVGWEPSNSALQAASRRSVKFEPISANSIGKSTASSNDSLHHPRSGPAHHPAMRDPTRLTSPKAA